MLELQDIMIHVGFGMPLPPTYLVMCQFPVFVGLL